MSLNLYAYVGNNPLTYTDPTGHEREGWNVGINIDNARRYTPGNDVYWQVKSSLGSDFKQWYPGAGQNDNSYFKYLFGMATLTSSNPEDNTEGKAAWAKSMLMFLFQLNYQENQDYLNGLIAFVTMSLDLGALKVGGRTFSLPTGTVWDCISGAEMAYTGTIIPEYFTLEAGGQSFFITNNATEHMAEYVMSKSLGYAYVNSQALLTSLQSAITDAVKGGIRYGEVIKVDDWELIFSAPRNTGELPAVKHALYKKE